MDYFGLRDIENLFDNTDDSDYYKPTLVKVLLKKNINIMKAGEIKTKNYQ